MRLYCQHRHGGILIKCLVQSSLVLSTTGAVNSGRKKGTFCVTLTLDVCHNIFWYLFGTRASVVRIQKLRGIDWLLIEYTEEHKYILLSCWNSNFSTSLYETWLLCDFKRDFYVFFKKDVFALFLRVLKSPV